MTPGVQLVREKTEVSGGVGKWMTQDYSYELESSSRGVDVFVALALKDSRLVEFKVKEIQRRRGQAITILTQVGATIHKPDFFPLFYL